MRLTWHPNRMDGYDQNKNEGDVECDYSEEEGRRVIECSDGTVVAGEDVPKTECSNPTVRRTSDTTVVVECGGQTQKVTWKAGCEGPFVLRTEEDVQRFAEKRCRMVVGDVTVTGISCDVRDGKVHCPETRAVEMPADAKRPCWRTRQRIVCSGGRSRVAPTAASFEAIGDLGDLTTLRYVTGSVVIEGNPRLQGVGLPRLSMIGNDLIVSNNPGLETLSGFVKLFVVGGNLEVSKNRRLRGWQPPLGLWLVEGSVMVASNQRLGLIGDLGAKNPRFSRHLHIKNGGGMVTDNDALGWCMSMEVGRFLGERGGADEIIVGGVSSTGKRCRRVNWMK